MATGPPSYMYSQFAATIQNPYNNVTKNLPHHPSSILTHSSSPSVPSKSSSSSATHSAATTTTATSTTTLNTTALPSSASTSASSLSPPPPAYPTGTNAAAPTPNLPGAQGPNPPAISPASTPAASTNHKLSNNTAHNRNNSGKRKREEQHSVWDPQYAKQVKLEHDVTPTAKETPVAFADRESMMASIKQIFQTNARVDFAGCYTVSDSSGDHKEYIQAIAHDIWKATGYRFTVKDHPRIKGGHKTRLWCSQDDAHGPKTKAKGGNNGNGSGLISGSSAAINEAPLRARYPCKSRLLISSKDTDVTNSRLVTVRLHHYVAHDPYIDANVPPEISKSAWEKMGWTNPSVTNANSAANTAAQPSTSGSAGASSVPASVTTPTPAANTTNNANSTWSHSSPSSFDTKPIITPTPSVDVKYQPQQSLPPPPTTAQSTSSIMSAPGPSPALVKEDPINRGYMHRPPSTTTGMPVSSTPVNAPPVTSTTPVNVMNGILAPSPVKSLSSPAVNSHQVRQQPHGHHTGFPPPTAFTPPGYPPPVHAQVQPSQLGKFSQPSATQSTHAQSGQQQQQQIQLSEVGMQQQRTKEIIHDMENLKRYISMIKEWCEAIEGLMNAGQGGQQPSSHPSQQQIQQLMKTAAVLQKDSGHFVRFVEESLMVFKSTNTLKMEAPHANPTSTVGASPRSGVGVTSHASSVAASTAFGTNTTPSSSAGQTTPSNAAISGPSASSSTLSAVLAAGGMGGINVGGMPSHGQGHAASTTIQAQQHQPPAISHSQSTQHHPQAPPQHAQPPRPPSHSLPSSNHQQQTHSRSQSQSQSHHSSPLLLHSQHNHPTQGLHSHASQPQHHNTHPSHAHQQALQHHQQSRRQSHSTSHPQPPPPSSAASQIPTNHPPSSRSHPSPHAHAHAQPQSHTHAHVSSHQQQQHTQPASHAQGPQHSIHHSPITQSQSQSQAQAHAQSQGQQHQHQHSHSPLNQAQVQATHHQQQAHQFQMHPHTSSSGNASYEERHGGSSGERVRGTGIGSAYVSGHSQGQAQGPGSHHHSHPPQPHHPHPHHPQHPIPPHMTSLPPSHSGLHSSMPSGNSSSSSSSGLPGPGRSGAGAASNAGASVSNAGTGVPIGMVINLGPAGSRGHTTDGVGPPSGAPTAATTGGGAGGGTATGFDPRRMGNRHSVHSLMDVKSLAGPGGAGSVELGGSSGSGGRNGPGGSNQLHSHSHYSHNQSHSSPILGPTSGRSSAAGGGGGVGGGGSSIADGSRADYAPPPTRSGGGHGHVYASSASHSHGNSYPTSSGHSGHVTAYPPSGHGGHAGGSGYGHAATSHLPMPALGGAGTGHSARSHQHSHSLPGFEGLRLR